jgi:hypothetical protein
VLDFLSDSAQSWLSILVDLTVLVGAVAAAYKFRVFDVLGQKYRSEVWCGSTATGSGEGPRVLFVGNYVIHNTGSRPLKITRVTLSLREFVGEDRILDSDDARELVRREYATDSGVSWFKVGAGERSIFPLRCYLDSIEGPLVLVCTFEWLHGGAPSEFAWLYDPRLPMTWWSEPTPGLPEPWFPKG